MTWKDNNAKMIKLHRWVVETYGKADHCENNPNHKGYFEWANIGHTYRKNPKDWIQLCRNCHRNLDSPSIIMNRNGIVGSSRNNHSRLVSFRLPNSVIDEIIVIYGNNISVGSHCRDIVLNHIVHRVNEVKS